MSLSPFFKSPFTDVTNNPVSQQWFGRCADMELKVMDCLEAYGLDRGFQKCEKLIEDFKECSLKHKQQGRVMAMRMERQRQYLTGERSGKEHYAPPPRIDSY